MALLVPNADHMILDSRPSLRRFTPGLTRKPTITSGNNGRMTARRQGMKSKSTLPNALFRDRSSSAGHQLRSPDRPFVSSRLDSPRLSRLASPRLFSTSDRYIFSPVPSKRRLRCYRPSGALS